MSDPASRARIVQCGNCGMIYDIDNIVPLCETPALGERLTAGDQVPAGECPEEDCHALCYLVVKALA